MSSEYDEFQPNETEDRKAKLIEKADKLQDLDKKIADAEQSVKDLKKQKDDLLNNVFPSMLDLEGVYDLGDGRSIKFKKVVRAGFSEKDPDRKKNGIKWLLDNDYDSIIKRNVLFQFGKGESEKCTKFLELIPQIEKNINSALPFNDKQDVHHATLTSWVNEHLAKGTELPMELLGVHSANTVKVLGQKKDD